MYIYNTKEIADTPLVNDYAREEFDELQYIKSNLTVNLANQYSANASHRALYEAPYSLATISLSQNALSTQRTENHEIITITAQANDSYNQIGWTNGSYLVQLPQEIIIVATHPIQMI